MSYSDPHAVECPECGSVKTRGRVGGWTPDGQRVRQRRCDDCSFQFVTVEVPVLLKDGSAPPYSWFDIDYRERQRDQARRRHGYHGLVTRKPIEGVARLLVGINIIPPKNVPKPRRRVTGDGFAGPQTGGRSKSADELEIARAVHRCRAGESVSSVAQELGIPASTLRYHLERAA